MDASALIRKLQAQRERDVEVAPGKVLVFRGPPETEFGRFMRPGVGMEAAIADVRDYVIGWRGITEADLLGSAVGASDEVPFSRELWCEVIPNRADWVKAVAPKLLDYIVDHVQRQEGIAKN